MTTKEQINEFEQAELQDARQEIFSRALDFASKIKQFPEFVDTDKLNEYLRERAKTLKIGVLK